jgi:hypothetical protein
MKKLICSVIAALGMIVLIPESGLAQEVPTTLKQGMPYGEARQTLIDAGWQANTIYIMYRRGYVSPNLQAMLDLGYHEAADCAGTGQGLCRFEFVTADGRKLVVVTQPAEPQPVLYRWWLEEEPS